MRLTFLTPTLDRSGAEKQLTMLAIGLKERTNWEIDLIALTRGGPFESELSRAGIHVTVLNKRLRFDPVCLTRLRSYLRRRKPDLLHTWMFTANSYGRIAVGQHPQFPVVISERCVDSWKSAWQFRVDRWLMPRTSKLLANSHPVAEFYEGVGYNSEEISVIPNGVMVPAQRDDEIRHRLRREWNLPERAKIVGYVGRLAKQKRIKEMLWAFQLLQQLSSNTYFVIAGDGPERSHLEDMAIRYTCDHLVRFVGHYPNGAELMNAFDLFWLGSEFEGMSNSLMEAMAAGVPPVVSDIPANRELVIPEVTGDLFPLGNRSALAQLSDRILNQPGIYDSMSQAARERMRNEFSVEQMIARHQDVYMQVLESSAHVPKDQNKA